MYLLTWHGTLLCQRPDGRLVQQNLPLAADAPPPWALPDTLAKPNAKHKDPLLGALRRADSALGHGFGLAQGEAFLCAEHHLGPVGFTRAAASYWETFIGISAIDLADLNRVLGHAWLYQDTRAVIARRDIRLLVDFRLALGSIELNLTRHLPLQPLMETAQAAQARRFLNLPKEPEMLLLTVAEPRGSALLPPREWPTRARREAEMMVLALHRQIQGREPEQAEFEADLRFVLEHGGAQALPEVMARLQPKGLHKIDPSPSEAENECQLIGLGRSCILASVLRKNGLAETPMPFDWLSSNAAMVRHCLETDFAVLLDQSHYESLTGKDRFYAPPEGADHHYYLKNFGVKRVFNHADPTNKIAFRYLEAAIDRFRQAIGKPGPKLFVQLQAASANDQEDFKLTCATLEKITDQPIYLQIVVQPPDRTRNMPLVSEAARHGPHKMLDFLPTSHMSGIRFERALDDDFLVWMIKAYKGRPLVGQAAQRTEKHEVRLAVAAFAEPAEIKPEDGVAAHIHAALQAFLTRLNLTRRFTFIAASAGSRFMPPEPVVFVVRLSAQTVTLYYDISAANIWLLLKRALGLVYMLDLALQLDPLPDGEFIAELGDRALRDNSVAFSANAARTTLIADSEFFGSAGYEDFRHTSQIHDISWEKRKAVIFWRGSPTGIRRFAPPPEGQEDDLAWLPRLSLCMSARRSPLAKKFDCALTSLGQIPEPHLQARIKQAGLLKPRVPQKQFLNYKFIMVIDGNSNAWSALFCALLTGACVLKVNSEQNFKQWYYDDLRPWVHFIPVASDLSDLDDIAAWLLAHDEQARAIGQAGRGFAMGLSFETAIEDGAERLRARILQG